MSNRTMRTLVAIPLCVALIWVGAMISIPLAEVPISLQTLMVFIVGLYLGPVYGVVAVLLYLGLGALGVPVFAKFSAGLKVLTGPTGGFLWGFILEAAFAGYVGQKLKQGLSIPVAILTAFSCLEAIFIVYLPGIPWFMHVLSKFNTLEKALPVVFYPFLIGDLLKALVAFIICIFVARRYDLVGKVSRVVAPAAKARVCDCAYCVKGERAIATAGVAYVAPAKKAAIQKAPAKPAAKVTPASAAAPAAKKAPAKAATSTATAPAKDAGAKETTKVVAASAAAASVAAVGVASAPAAKARVCDCAYCVKGERAIATAAVDYVAPAKKVAATTTTAAAQKDTRANETTAKVATASAAATGVAAVGAASAQATEEDNCGCAYCLDENHTTVGEHCTCNYCLTRNSKKHDY